MILSKSILNLRISKVLRNFSATKIVKRIRQILKNRIFIGYTIFFTIFALTALFLVFVASFLLPTNQAQDFIDQKNIQIYIDWNGFHPKEAKIKSIKEYKFKFRKGWFVSCSEITIPSLDMSIPLPQNDKEIPLRIALIGVYELKCKESSHRMKLIVV